MTKPLNTFMKIKMELTEKDWVRYQRFTWGKGRHAQVKQILLLILVFIILPSFAFYNIADVSGDPSKHVWVGSYYILILFVYLLYKWFIGYPLKYRQSLELFQVKLIYEFFEESIKVIQKGPVYGGEITLAYTDLKKVYETKSFFYLIPNKGLPLILKKDILSDPLNLSEWLKKKTGKCFINCQ